MWNSSRELPNRWKFLALAVRAGRWFLLLSLAVTLGCTTATEPTVHLDSTSADASETADVAVPSDTPPDTPPSAPATAESTTADAVPPLPAPELPSASAWPLFRGTPQAAGVASGPLPNELQLVWQNRYQMGFESAPIIVEDAIYVGCLDGYLYALNLADGSERWKFYSELGFSAPAAVRDGRIYIGDTEGRFYCLDAATGEPIWGFETQAEINAGANFYQDTVLVGSQDASLYCLDAADGTERWRYTINDMIQCMPTVVEGRGFIAGCDSMLHVVNLDTGQRETTIDIGGPTGATPAVLGDMLFFGTQSEEILGINWRQAKIAWRYRHFKRKFPYQSSAAVTPEVLIVGGRDKMIHALNPRTGEELWTYMTGARIDGSPVIVGEIAYIGSEDGRLYGARLTDGEIVWQYDAGAGFVGSPAVAAGRLVIGDSRGGLYCFGGK